MPPPELVGDAGPAPTPAIVQISVPDLDVDAVIAGVVHCSRRKAAQK